MLAAIMKQVREDDWPSTAIVCAKYLCVDKQFDVRANRELNVEYFDSIQGYEAWKTQKSEWVRGTDYDFSVTGTAYVWDWGQEFYEHVAI